jgi:membrane protease YdiL (CAAX protease family)
MGPAATADKQARGLIGIAAAAGGLVVFAVFAHQSLPWLAIGVGGLAISALAIAWSGFGNSAPAELLGLDRFSGKIAIVTIVAGVLGAVAGLAHRDALGITLFPTGNIEAFVLTACLIGASEELIYRGWLLGRARMFGWPAAIVIAAVAHAAYKTALFAWPADPTPVDLADIAAWTAAGGIVLGLMRRLSGSALPPMLAHIAFDFVVYRAVAHAPWWVWG